MDRAILKRCRSPREVFESLEKWHDPESEMATQRLYDKFHEFAIPPHSSPIAALHDLENISNQMYEKGIGRIPKTVLHARFVRALPNKYSLVKETLQSMKNRDRKEIIRMISTRCSNLPQKKGAQRYSRCSSIHSSPAKAAAVAVRDEVAAAEAGVDRAVDAVEAATVQEVTATAPKIPIIVQVEPKGAAAEAAAAVAVASTCLLTAVFAVDRWAIGEKTAQRRRANSYPGV